MKISATVKKCSSLLLTGVLCITMLAGCGSSSGTSVSFDDLEWGMSYEDAKNQLTESEGVEPTETADGTKLQLQVENYLGVDGVSARIDCDFEEEALEEVFIYLEFDEDTYSNEEIMERYQEILTDSLGDSSDDTDEMVTWELSATDVELANFSYGVLVIAYTQAE